MPEVLAALIPVAQDAATWSKQSPWLESVQGGVLGLIGQGTVIGAQAVAWNAFASAITAIQAGRVDLVDPMAALGG